MKEEIKNATILEKTVRRENGKILKPSWICSTLTEFRICGSATVCSICSLSGLVYTPSVRKSAVQDDMFVQDDKFGFTLAEVLITLGIIGVVAAMTMPTLIAKIQNNILKNQFKRTYSVITNAFARVELDLGYKPECYYDMNGNNGSLSECNVLLNQLEKELKVAKVCENNALKNGCLPKSSYLGYENVMKNNNPDMSDDDLNKLPQMIGCGFKKNSMENFYRSVVLNDGTIIVYHNNWPKLFAVDINGQKKPNKWGYDLYVFDVVSDVKSPLILQGVNAGGCMPVEKGGMATYDFIRYVYK